MARIAYGFGGGGGKGTRRNQPGEGEGGGGGLLGTPLGVVEITAGQTKFVPLNHKRKIAAAGLGGLCLGMLLMQSVRRR